MPDFFDSLESLGLWSFEMLWVPLAAWTLVAALTLLLDTHVPLRRPLVRQRLLVALLIALPLGIAFRLVHPLALPAPTPVALDLFVPLETPIAPSLDAAPVSTPARPVLPLVAGFLVLLMGVAAAGGFVRLAVQRARLHRWLRGLAVLPDAARPAAIQRMIAQMCDPSVRVRLVDADVSPFTYGIVRPAIVLPARLMGDADAFRLALAHEIAHIAHGDARWHLAARLSAAFVPWHPLAHRLLRRVELRREQAADAYVLGHFPVARRRYADLLIDFGAVPAPAAALSASIHQLKPRVAAMKTPLDLRSRGLAPALALLLSLTATLSLRAQDTTEVPVDVNVDVEVPTDVYVVVEQQPRLIGGLEALQAEVQYPEIAQRAGIQGRVIVQFVVDENGAVQNPKIVRGIGAGCDEEALRAIRTARFEPGRQHGETVKVQMTLPVTFRLPGVPPPPPAPSVPSVPPAPPIGDEVFVVVEAMPELIGGLDGLTSQVKYPETARRAGVEGRVIVQFVVGKDGTVRDAQVVRGVGAGVDEEALRVIRAARFTPGMQRGQAVNVRMTLPVTFKLGRAQVDAQNAQTGVTGLRLVGLQRTTNGFTGKVTDARTGQPLSGANVAVNGTQIGAATDPEGRFTLRGVPETATTLRVSFVGFEQITVPLESGAAGLLPEGYVLGGVPNPSSGKTEIRFAVPQTGQARVEVYDALGRRVDVLFDEMAAPGQTYRVLFDGDAHESGVYFFRLMHDGHTLTHALTLAR